MSRILFAWELGGGTGHLHHLAAVARPLVERGHEAVFAVRDLTNAQRILGVADGRLLQAPVWLRPSRLPPAANYAEVLNRVGYLDAGALAGLIGAWRELIRLVRPDLLLAEHSPTALIAGRLEGVRRASLGTGFCAPPRASPMPSIQPWQKIPQNRLAEADRGVLGRLNEALSRLGGAPLAVLADIFDIDENFLCTFPEVDHYGAREDAYYRGPLIDTSPAGEAPWPPGDGDRVFVCYRTGYPHFGKLVRQLAELGLPTLVVADDASKTVIRNHSTERLRIVTGQVGLAATARTCRVALSHAGHGSCVELLLGGCPLVMLPVVVEQYQFAYRVVRYGAGVMAAPAGGKPDCAAAVRRVLDTPALATRATAFAERHVKFDPAAAIEGIVARCEEMFNLE